MSGFGGVIKLTGEKDYLNALKRIRQSLRETASSLSAISSSFKDNTRDMDNTRKAAGKLRDILKKQSDDANNLRSSYEKMQKIFENNREEINKLKKSYKNAREELEKIEKQAGKTSDQYKRQADEVKKLEQNLERETKKQQDNEVALSKMRTELNNSKTALNKTRGELEKTESALKNNAETVKKTSSEYGKLKSTIEKQEEALKKLKDQYKEVALKEGDASKTAKDLAGKIKDLSEKLEDNKTKLKNVDDAAEKLSGGLKDVGDNAKNASDKFGVFKTALGNFVSNVALRAVDKLKELAVEAFNVGKNFEYGMSRVAAISGASGEDFQKLRDKAKEMGKTTIFTAREAADALEYMAVAGWRPQEMLDGIQGVLNLAAASGEDFALTSDILTDALTAFRRPASDAGILADIMAAAMANSNTNVEKMGETFKYVAPIAGSLGYSMEDTAIAIGTMADAGIKASQAGTDLRSIFTRLASNVGASKNQLGALDVLTERLGVSFYDASGKTRPFIDILTEARQAWQGLSEEEQINYAKTIAGQRAMSGWLALMNTTPEKFNQITDSIKNSGGAAERMAKTMTDNVEGDLKLFKSKMEDASIDLAKAFEPETRGTIGALGGLSEGMKFIAENAPQFKAALATIAAGVSSFILATQGANIVSGLTGAISGLWAVIAANPIGATIALVAALVAGFVTLWNNSEEFRNFWINLWNTIKNAVEPVIKGISEWFSKAWGNVKKVWAPVGKFFSDLFNGIVETVTPIANSVGNAFKEAWELIKSVWDFFSPYFRGLWEGIKSIFGAVAKVVALPFKNAWEMIKLYWGTAVDFFKTIWNNIKIIFGSVKKVLVSAFKTAWEGIKAVWNVVTSYFKAIWDTIAGIFKVVRKVLTGDFQGAWEGIKGIVSTWAGFFRTVWENIKNVFRAVKEFFKTTFSAAWQAVKGVFSGWVGFFRNLWQRIKNTFSNIGQNIASAIGGAVKRAINGVISMIEGTMNTAINLINGAIRLINMIPGVGIGELGHLRLPRLAKGGVLDNGPRTVIAGEDGAEAIVPLEKNTKWISLVANQLQRQMLPQLSNGTDAYPDMRAQTEFNSLVNSFKQALGEMKVVMDEETFGKFVDRTVSDAIYD